MSIPRLPGFLKTEEPFDEFEFSSSQLFSSSSNFNSGEQLRNFACAIEELFVDQVRFALYVAYKSVCDRRDDWWEESRVHVRSDSPPQQVVARIEALPSQRPVRDDGIRKPSERLRATLDTILDIGVEEGVERGSIRAKDLQEILDDASSLQRIYEDLHGDCS